MSVNQEQQDCKQGKMESNSREDKARQLRLLHIVDMVKQGNYPNTTDFRKKFEVSRSTVMRDIDFLKDRYMVPLDYSKEHNGYFLSDPNYTIPSFLLTEGELFTLHIILPLMEQYKGTPLEPVFESIMKQMLDMLPKDVAVSTSFNADQVHFISNPQPQIDQEIFFKVLEGIQERKTLDFAYRSIKRQEYIQRKFNPYKILCQRGDWYILGYCHRHQEFRVYNMARIQNISVAERFEWDESFDINSHIDPDFGVWAQGKSFTVELLFSQEVHTFILERQWHVGQRCCLQEDGRVLLTFETNQFDEILHWVMSFGHKVLVLNPPELKEAIRREIATMAKMY
ncbi:MAG: WYL domain-containing transcriptional regulator [Treponema sp.]|nr:WYL domain-containing protein [Spirochaetaceae bacterium]MDD7275310.1 WYL domain-containing transcriptional regulator [Treponema sp.]